MLSRIRARPSASGSSNGVRGSRRESNWNGGIERKVIVNHPTKLVVKRNHFKPLQKPLFDEAEVRKALASIIERGSVFEVRALDAQPIR